ncbi:hypothetical protein ACFPRA_01390 [Sporosarcina soli]|uniref:Uncharacterized protein n=1 Tax=Sporosarcina soli TaxID=334736 RepID=A0ABW0TDP4_9BACL
MALADITAVLDAAVLGESRYVFVLVQTNSTEQMVIIPNEDIAAKKSFYEESFNIDGTHKAYPGIALLAADHGDEPVNIKLRNDFYGGEVDVDEEEESGETE